ncbi:hypothetical protein BGZ81_004544 [Podila clonocystis]|nr:hypothetical protein BGZ81_004544 [Podila clonocystis]
MNPSTKVIRHDSPTLFTLPAEIFHMIFSYFVRNNFVKCATLNKAFHALVTPHLWGNLQFRTSDQVQRFLTDASQQAFARNAGLVRYLVTNEELYHLFLPVKAMSSKSSSSSACLKNQSPLAADGIYHVAVCTNLQHICLAGSGEYFQYVPVRNPIGIEKENAISALFLQNLSLTSVLIHSNVRPKALLRMVSAELPNLRTFEVRNRISAWTAQALLLNLPECIESVDLCIEEDNVSNGPDMLEVVPLTQPKKHPALKYLLLDIDSTSREEIVLLPFLDSCSMRLEQFGYFTPRCFNNDKIRSALGRLGVEMDVLDSEALHGNWSSTDGEIAAALMLSSKWQEIYLEGFGYAGSLTLAAILDHGEHLRTVELSGCGDFSSKDLCSILRRCKFLERFVTIDEREPDPITDPGFSGADLIAFDWASRSLKTWSCRIEVPSSHEIQRQIYQKLALQTKLKCLRLGCIPMDSDWGDETEQQEECLEMTLASGLDELSVLKEIEELDVSHMHQSMGVPELEWMAANWPKLKTVTGLYKTCLNPVPGALEWVLEHHDEWISDSEMVY